MATTIKVSEELRDRIVRDAKEQNLTAAGLLERLLDDYDRRRRMEAFGRVVRGAQDDYWRDFHDWDVALDDGLLDT